MYSGAHRDVPCVLNGPCNGRSDVAAAGESKRLCVLFSAQGLARPFGFQIARVQRRIGAFRIPAFLGWARSGGGDRASCSQVYVAHTLRSVCARAHDGDPRSPRACVTWVCARFVSTMVVSRS